MARLVAGRIAQFFVLAFLIATLLFFVTRVVGDPATLILGEDANPTAVAQIRERLGLNRPIGVQYTSFLWDLAPKFTSEGFTALDFGESFRYHRPASSLVFERLPNTLVLGMLAFLFAAALSLPLGIAAAAMWRSNKQYAIMGVALVGQSVPHFVLSILLVLVFSVWLGVLPVFGFNGPSSLILPMIALAMWPLARFTRILRTQLVEVLGNDYVRSARAKGLSEWTILRRHALPNAALPWLAVVGMDFGSLLGGSIVIEAVFVWPGIGNLMVDSIGQRDYPVLQACIFVVALLVVMGNLLADIAYKSADPRIRMG